VPIETKFHAPRSRPEWVARPGLIQHLADATGKLVLVTAPAGSGKTTAVAQWRAAAAETRPFAWVSLDGGDNDPGRLWWHVVCALERACPQIAAEDVLGALRVRLPDITGTVLPILLNRLAALSAPVVLVLDDYHVIRSASCHDQLEFLLLHLPASTQITLVTRTDPPMPLARLRAVGELAEIRAQELRFTGEQAAALVHGVTGIQLSRPDAADLVERTEGWAAGVYLAALSLRGHPSPHLFVRHFTGDNRFIVDFLAEEVLSRQPPEIQRFLERTCILGRFNAALCGAVSGTADAAGILDRLERGNLFIVPLDEVREWFRYHHLLAQVLRGRLARTEPGLVPALHRSASVWHRQHGSPDEAVGHAIAAGDLAPATELIASHWFAYVASGQVATVQRWMRSLGDDWIASSPLAAHCAAWSAALSSGPQSARRWLPVIEAGGDEGPLPDGMGSLRFSAALLQGVYGFDGIRVMRDSAAAAASLADDPASPWHALAWAALGFSRYLSGEPEAAAAPVEKALRSDVAHPLTQIVALSTKALLAVDAGQLPRGSELTQRACALARRDDLSGTPSASLAHVAAGAVHAARGRPAEARRELELALGSRQQIAGSSPWPTLVATLLLAHVMLDAGDDDKAERLAEEAGDVLTSLPDGAQSLRARLEALERRLPGARRQGPLAEPLTEREVAVLRLLGGPLSVREIGQELYVSANTVKTHTQAIYRKLGVSTRHEAVEQGRQLGILRYAS